MNRSTACLDWAERLRNGQSIIPPPLYPEQAAQALEVFKQLRIVDAPNSPTYGEACAPWAFDLVESIFGAYNPQTGRREITEWFVLIPKKNIKSTLAAGVMMTALALNWRESAEFTILAPTIEVANNSFGPAQDIVRADEDLDVLMHVQSHIKTITHRDKQAKLKVIAADSNSAAGKKSVGTLVEELWLFGKRHGAAAMLREAMGGLASRPEGFVIYVTTQSDEPPAGVFKEKLQYARDVRDGIIHDPRFVPVIFEYPKDMIDSGDHLKPENFHMVNPNMGYSVDEEFLIREFGKAQAAGPHGLADFLAKHLNVEIGLNLRSDRWAGADYWQACGGDRVTVERLLTECEVIDIGIDGGGLDDLLGFSAAGRKADGTWLMYFKAWAHPTVMERRKSEAARFADFQRDGDLVIVDRIGVDIADVVALCVQINDSGLLDKIGVDPHGIGAILDALSEAGIEQEKIIGISQGWKLTGAIKTLERKLAELGVKHGNQPMMAWCVGNAKVEPRGNAITITKQAAGFAKIDPLMAGFNAVSLLSLNPQTPKAEMYIL